MVKVGCKYGLDELILNQIEEEYKKRWVLKFLSSADKSNQIVRWPYNISGNKGFEVEVGYLPDGEYEVSCGDFSKTATKTAGGKTFTIYGIKRRVFSVKDGEVIYPDCSVDKYADSNRKNLPNMGYPVGGAKTPELNIPSECLTSEYMGKQTTLSEGVPKTVSSSGLKLDDYVLENIMEGTSYRILDVGDGRYMLHYMCADCGERTEFQIRPKKPGEFEE